MRRLLTSVLLALLLAACAGTTTHGLTPVSSIPSPAAPPAGAEAGPSTVTEIAAQDRAAAALVERGAILYETYCVKCHGGATGGQMMDFPPRHNANGHTWHHPDCQLIEVVLNGSGEMGEMMREMMGVPETVPRMPAWKDTLTKGDVAAILAYIKTWWTEEQRQQQAAITEELCGPR